MPSKRRGQKKIIAGNKEQLLPYFIQSMKKKLLIRISQFTTNLISCFFFFLLKKVGATTKTKGNRIVYKFRLDHYTRHKHNTNV